MSNTKKAYSAPVLESLNVRATRNIDIGAGIGAGVAGLGATVSVAVGLSS